ncbi:hypothetical protein C0J52_00539 [Blattella germanica]|nr:hypothetical protein C0J52_00539 [Blattella germanica]
MFVCLSYFYEKSKSNHCLDILMKINHDNIIGLQDGVIDNVVSSIYLKSLYFNLPVPKCGICMSF